ncbi:toprim domain-containing protein [Mycoplasma sp. 1199]|uniref:toprim domain-containing protein n=1 Tax=Mycoplasma sp. 1199 TaxID=3108526 RepID=UPI002B1DA78F|nr:toprim domain-containing protein [Mycoplasma sp. 1199]MEA4205906.1 toprim domain-containing protein [Mycoplasma sp. 1199]
MFNTEQINKFLEVIRQIPGISKKQAEKIVYWILEAEKEQVQQVAQAFIDVKEKTTFCPICSQVIENNYCSICDNSSRDNTLLIVENRQVMQKIEDANIYNGKYYVFSHLIINEYEEQKYQKEIQKLLDYAQKFDEIILGISPSIKGEVTNEFLKEKLTKQNLKVTRLAIGLPVGSSVDYIDAITLKFSLINRQN